MIKRSLTYLFCITFPLSLVGVTKETVTMAGGTAHIPVMQEAAKILAAEGIELMVAAGGSGVGIQKVGNGLVDIGNSGRPLTNAEKAKYGLQEYRFAIDGIAFIVHPLSQLENLDVAMAQQIFSGTKTDWEPFTKKKGAIHIYTREESSGTRQTVKEIVMNEVSFSTGAYVVTSNSAMKMAVSNDKESIGFCSIGHLDGSVKALSFSNIYPTQAQAASGAYPVMRPLLMVVRKNPSLAVQRVLTLIQSSDFANKILAHGFLPVSAP